MLTLNLRGWLAAIVIVTIGLCSIPAEAASWKSIRDNAMGLRERGQSEEAYKKALSVKVSSAADVVDQQFVAGYIALQSLKRSDIALQHFTAMANATSQLKSNQHNSRSQSGYWLGKTLEALGRGADAGQMYAAAAAYRDTFYGQMAASKMALTDTSSVLKRYATSYPTMEVFWHDPRVARELLFAIIRAESGFRPTAVSPAGAKGMMQVMDGTATMVGKAAGVSIDLGLMAKNKNYNVAVGSKHLGDLLVTYNGNVLLAAAAYNAGKGKSDEWITRFGDPRRAGIDPVNWVENIPFSETRNYVKQVVASYIVYLAISSGS